MHPSKLGYDPYFTLRLLHKFITNLLVKIHFFGTIRARVRSSKSGNDLYITLH